MSATEYATVRNAHRASALLSLADRLGCTIREAERRLADGTAAGEIRRAQPRHQAHHAAEAGQ